MIIYYKTIDLFPAIEMEYSEMQNLVKEILKQTGNKNKLIFSIFKDADNNKKKFNPNNWIVKLPDITSKLPIFEGKVVFRAKYEGYTGQVIENPTWREILVEANRAANGDHVFLESLDFKKGKGEISCVEMTFGS